MKIWIDGYEANVPQRLGSSQVAFQLLKSLEEIDKRNEYSVLLPKSPMHDLPREREGWRYKVLRPRRLWTRIALPLALYSVYPQPDLIFSPTHYIPRFSPIKRVVTIFDLSFLHFPETFKKNDLWQLKNWTEYSIKNSSAILTISKSTRDDIVKEYSVSGDKITVAYPGYDQRIFKPSSSKDSIEEVKRRYKTGDSYIIYIGTIQPRKNLERLIEAFSETKGFNLVIVGKTTGEGRQGWMFEDILKKPRELGIDDKVVFTGFVPEEDLVYLLNGAVAYINPSLYEGFGIPVVEAMACGVPVLVSNTSSLPEVVGKAGVMFDPYSVEKMRDAMKEVVENEKIRKDLSEKGLEQAGKFSWEGMAKEVLKVFEDLQ